MRRIMKSRCTPPSALPVEIEGGYPQAMARCLYTPLSERAHKGRKVTSTGSQSDQYWSPRQPVLVTMGEQYCSDQRPVLVVIAPSEVARYSPHREYDAEGRKREQTANMGGLHFKRSKPRDRARREILFIAVHRRSIIRLCGDNYWSVHERPLLLSFPSTTSFHRPHEYPLKSRAEYPRLTPPMRSSFGARESSVESLYL